MANSIMESAPFLADQRYAVKDYNLNITARAKFKHGGRRRLPEVEIRRIEIYPFTSGYTLRTATPMRHEIIYSLVRKHISRVLIGGAVVSVAVLPQGFALSGMFFWVVLALVLVASAFFRSRRISRRFSGQILEFVFAPTPMTSLYQGLRNHGVLSEDIQEISLMSADIEQSLMYYVEGDRKSAFFDVLEKSPNTRVSLYGPCSFDIQACNGIAIKRTSDRYVEHINVLSTKDHRHFVWYEPYHTIVDGKHFFPAGAYLIEVSEQTATKLRNDLNGLPLVSS